MKTIFFIFSGLWQPPMTSEVMMLLKSQICLARAFQNGMTLAYRIKIEVSRPLLEVRRFFQWCQGMSLGILKRFREKKVQFFFRDFNFGGNIQRLLQ